MPEIKDLTRLLFIAITAVMVAGNAWAQVSFGPIYERFPLTLKPGERVEAVSPFYYKETSEDQKTTVFPPFISITDMPGVDAKEIDVLYPLLTYDRFGKEYRFQIIQLFAFSGGQTQEEEQKRRFTLFPFYFQQRAPNTNLNYTAFFPLYGTLKNRLFREEIRFVAFPIYGQSRKKDYVTDNYVYPIFHLREGEGLKGWQFWPLAGHEHKELTTRTNIYGEIEKVAGHDKLMVLWPFFFDNHLEIGTENPQHQQILFPFYAYTRAPLRDSTTYFWPFGLTITDEREKKYHEVGAPWPLIVFARGEGKTANRVWPFFGHAHNASLRSDFILWPIYKYNRLTSSPLDRERARILFFLYSDISEKNTDSGQQRRRRDFWPLYTHQKDFNGNSRLQILAPVEPVLSNNKSIERDYSHLWSIWRSENNPKEGLHSESLLWNLYRRDTGKETRKCSLLFGLFQYQSTPAGRETRLFYIPVSRTGTGASKTAPDKPAAPVKTPGS